MAHVVKSTYHTNMSDWLAQEHAMPYINEPRTVTYTLQADGHFAVDIVDPITNN